MGIIMDLDAVEWLNPILTDFDWFLMRKINKNHYLQGVYDVLTTEELWDK